MNEDEWNTSIFCEQALRWLKPTSARKLNLFTLTCFERVDVGFWDPRTLEALKSMERFLEGTASASELSVVERAAWDAAADWGEVGIASAPTDSEVHKVLEEKSLLHRCAAESVTSLLSSSSELDRAIRAGVSVFDIGYNPHGGEYVRDIFGNPFRPVALDPRWLSSTVVDLARIIYDERAFERLPILADALMDAGCDSEEIINHCRGPGPHVPGCWVVDLILGKE